MMTMQSLFKELQETSIQQYNANRILTKANSLARDEILKKAVTDFGNEIVMRSPLRMKQASEQGLFSCCIFECQDDETYSDDFRMAFLLRGPFNWAKTISFFEMKNTQSVFDYVADSISPINVHLKFNRSSRTHMIIASWKTKNFT